MTETVQIANTILQQIQAQDVWALNAWGCNYKQKVAETSRVLKDGPFAGSGIRGGVTFGIRTPRYQKATYVSIFLMGSDTYSIEVFSCRITKNGVIRKTLGTAEDVYCFDLITVIDSLVENKESRRR
jgi:hypothetical protein